MSVTCQDCGQSNCYFWNDNERCYYCRRRWSTSFHYRSGNIKICCDCYLKCDDQVIRTIKAIQESDFFTVSSIIIEYLYGRNIKLEPIRWWLCSICPKEGTSMVWFGKKGNNVVCRECAEKHNIVQTQTINRYKNFGKCQRFLICF